jgi:hypothetical protein
LDDDDHGDRGGNGDASGDETVRRIKKDPDAQDGDETVVAVKVKKERKLTPGSGGKRKERRITKFKRDNQLGLG